LIALVGLILVFARPMACAQTRSYTSRSAFMTACQSLSGIQQEISFEPYLYQYPYGQEGWYEGSLTVSDVTFYGNILVREDGISIAGEACLNNYDMGEPLAIHFQNGAFAFGADYSSLSWPHNTTNFTATIAVEGGNIFSFSCAPGPGSTFFGFIAAVPFQDLTYSDGGAFEQTPLGPLHEELIGNPFTVTETPVVLASPSRLPAGLVQFILEGNVGLTYVVEASTNLVNWTPLTTLVATNGAMPVLDTAATNFNHRFYRAVGK